MGILIDASTDRCKFDLAAPNGAPTGDFTCMGWFLATSFPASDTTFFMFGSQTTAAAFYVQPSSAAKLQVFALNALGGTGATTVSTSTWHHVALVGNTGTTQAFTCYLNGVSEVTGNSGALAYNAGRVEFGNTNSGEWLRGRFAAGKMWNAKLTQAEIVNEQFQMMPERTANLWGWWPFLKDTDLVDYSGNARSMTGTTLAYGDGPPVAWSGFLPSVYIPAAVGQPTMRRWPGVPHLGPGPRQPGRTW